MFSGVEPTCSGQCSVHCGRVETLFEDLKVILLQLNDRFDRQEAGVQRLSTKFDGLLKSVQQQQVQNEQRFDKLRCRKAPPKRQLDSQSSASMANGQSPLSNTSGCDFTPANAEALFLPFLRSHLAAAPLSLHVEERNFFCDEQQHDDEFVDNDCDEASESLPVDAGASSLIANQLCTTSSRYFLRTDSQQAEDGTSVPVAADVADDSDLRDHFFSLPQKEEMNDDINEDCSIVHDYSSHAYFPSNSMPRPSSTAAGCGDANSLAGDISNVGASAQSYFCTECDRTFATKATFKRHVETMHTQVRFTCPRCGFESKRRDYIAVHMRTGVCARRGQGARRRTPSPPALANSELLHRLLYAQRETLGV